MHSFFWASILGSMFTPVIFACGLCITGFFNPGFLKDKPWSRTFLGTLFFLFILQAGHSFVKAGFQTQNLMLLLGIVCMKFISNSPIIQKFHNPFHSRRVYLRMACLWIGYFLLASAWQYFPFLLGGQFSADFISHDNLFLARLSESISDTGIENTFIFGNDFTPSLQGTTPYHYVDLWLNGFFKEIFNLPAVSMLLFFTRPILLALVMVGIMAWAEFLRIGFLGKCSSVFQPVFLLFASGIPWYVFYENEYIKYTSDLFIQPMMGFEVQKLIPVYLGLVLSGLFFLNGNKTTSVASLVLIGIGNANTAPVWFAWVCVLAGLNFLLKGKSGTQVKDALLIFLPMLGLLVFYGFSGNVLLEKTLFHDFNSLGFGRWTPDHAYLLKVVPGSILLAYIPLFVWRKFWNENFRTGLFIPTGVMFLVSFFAWLFTNQSIGWDAIQFMSNTFIPFLNLLVIGFILKGNVFMKWSGGAMVVLGFIGAVFFASRNVENGKETSTSLIYQQKTIEWFEKSKSGKVAFTLSSEDYQNSPAHRHPFLYVPGEHFALSNKNEKFFNLNVYPGSEFENLYTDPHTRRLMIYSPFYQFFMNARSLDEHKKVGEIKADFLKAQNIKIWIFGPGAPIDSIISGLLLDSIRDPKTNELAVWLR